ncbi:MAG: ferritin family protein [Candidatus Marinimicrobia bacterium]|nr:ferritin family protein [Candidatus Neomarinimicrobiota bacterium]MCF7851461.1 ferritin family protein [Candidatus Neomarinimicrobiota bacterium]MCF7904098.1 ferritin family protein [Candidatus Neomarinimicrobiota bacterium]
MSLKDKISSMNMSEIVEMCIDQEQQAIDLYTMAMDQAKDDAARQKFQELVDMETVHKVSLKSFEIERYIDLPPADLKVTDYLMEPTMNDNLTTQEILIVAAKREDKTAKMYQDLADHFSADKKLNTFFQMMADEELRHKHDLESEYEQEFLPEG